MKVGEMFPSKYLSGSDLAGRSVNVTIASVRTEKLRDPHTFEEANKFILYFDGKQKGLILSRTIATQIAQALGDDDAAHWSGHQIALYPETVKAFGEEHLVVRVRAVQPAEAPKNGAK